MLFVIDIGNTNIVIGVFRGEELLHHWRLETNRNRSSDEYGISIKELLEHVDLDFSSFSGVIISSVVPPLVFAIERMCQTYFKCQPLFVDFRLCQKLLKIKIDNPSELGADRLVNAVAGVFTYGAPLILIDFGTATTFCYVNKKNDYCGGAIAPGIMLATEALYKKAAKLPYIELEMPPSVVGANTILAMQSGILYGYVGLVEGIVKKMISVSELTPKVVATGGLASLIADQTKVIDVVDPFLTLKGLQIIYKEKIG